MPDRRKPVKSKYTVDRNFPGAFEGETVSRRRFMDLVTNGAGAVAAAAFTLPALGFALAPVFTRQPWQWQPVGPPSDFEQPDTYVVKVITLVAGMGEAGKSIAYMRKRDSSIDTEPADQYNQYIALSSRCMHLGCPVRYVSAAPALRLSVPWWRVRLSRPGCRRPTRATARSLLYPAQQRPRRGRSALLGKQRTASLLPPRPS